MALYNPRPRKMFTYSLIPLSMNQTIKDVIMIMIYKSVLWACGSTNGVKAWHSKSDDDGSRKNCAKCAKTASKIKCDFACSATLASRMRSSSSLMLAIWCSTPGSESKVAMKPMLFSYNYLKKRKSCFINVIRSTTIRSTASLENLKSLDRSKTWDFRERPYYLYSQLQPNY